MEYLKLNRPFSPCAEKARFFIQNLTPDNLNGIALCAALPERTTSNIKNT